MSNPYAGTRRWKWTPARSLSYTCARGKEWSGVRGLADLCGSPSTERGRMKELGTYLLLLLTFLGLLGLAVFLLEKYAGSP